MSRQLLPIYVLQTISEFNESRPSGLHVDASSPEMVIMLQGLAKVFVGK
jgi:hypothetical protein